MSIALAAVAAFTAGVILTALFGAKLFSMIKGELFAMETRLKTAIQTAASKLPGPGAPTP